MSMSRQDAGGTEEHERTGMARVLAAVADGLAV
jgi:hypothetical protein